MNAGLPASIRSAGSYALPCPSEEFHPNVKAGSASEDDDSGLTTEEEGLCHLGREDSDDSIRTLSSSCSSHDLDERAPHASRPTSLATSFRSAVRHASMFLVVLVHFAATVILWRQGPATRCGQARESLCGHEGHSIVEEGLPWEMHRKGMNLLVCVIVGFYVAAHLLMKRDRSPLARQAAHCLLLNVLRLVTSEMEVVVSWCRYGGAGLMGHYVVENVEELLSVLFTWRFQRMAQTRLEVLQSGAGEAVGNMGAVHIRNLRRATTLFGILDLVGGLVGRLPCRNRVILALVTYGLFQAFRAVSYVVIGVCLGQAVSIVLRATALKGSRSSGQLGAEADWSRAVLNKAWTGMVVPCMVNAVLYGVLSILSGVKTLDAEDFGRVEVFSFWTPTCYLLICVVDFACLFYTAGFFLARGPANERPAMRVPSDTDPKASLPSMRPEGSAGAEWDATVRRLAARSITVGALLDFYGMLGSSYMPHFDPSAHKTRDVVRQAVIPASRVEGGGRAYAEVIGPGKRELPQVMCTHTWDNLFVHLVAAVVADALDIDDYGHVAACLARGRQAYLEERLRRQGALQRTYWICAFCVNQHASICGGFPPAPLGDSDALGRWDAARRDSVTGEVFSVCPCPQPKRFNEHVGECELNKFDDMMYLLCNERVDFRQLIAVDEHFELFTRAWCIAELVQGHLSQIPQFVRLHSSRVLDVKADDLSMYVKLATLTVAKCKASRVEDRDAILARIPDLQEYDAQLQRLIFGQRGLFGQRLVGFGALEAAALAARRVQMAAQAAPCDYQQSASPSRPKSVASGGPSDEDLGLFGR